MGKGIFLFSLIFCTTKVWAQATTSPLTLNTISGVSNFTNVTVATTSGIGSTTPAQGVITAYGGMAGPDCSGGISNTQTCNSCTVAGLSCSDGTNEKAPLCACNPARIYDSLIITVS